MTFFIRRIHHSFTPFTGCANSSSTSNDRLTDDDNGRRLGVAYKLEVLDVDLSVRVSFFRFRFSFFEVVLFYFIFLPFALHLSTFSHYNLASRVLFLVVFFFMSFFHTWLFLVFFPFLNAVYELADNKHRPVVFLHTHDLTSFSQYLALLSVADAFLVTSLREGMALRYISFVFSLAVFLTSLF